ncbi:type II secretion system ATPase GspE [Acinetobacter guillouiae]|jgi:general secretion pathway protein E|uniref:Type II secretion system protein E n=2 Tax=Acinetobacter guillouiae TaxID=106649 RepID=N8X4Y7_ACIGI|nr:MULTISPECIES: type II secretion system ATPase GspE [Acinetobacter]MDN5417260.1 type II secretion system ATPase GspE [Acinetobacter sp.]ENU56510.1 type II secretion system protein E [Acinetobacter guillouiae CIP 63.46]ENV19311.1 type II secretion system protein E [Acinetobacter guillouiae NIPH 991]KAB0623529.1 type II secretion system protein GspE [Acinetobacter guillouiae]KQX02543.1 type II secretion system protein GspE [Acinetobacter sp. Root1280]
MQVLKQLQIPYSFAKRHGVLLRYEGDQVFIVRRQDTAQIAIQEARRYLGRTAQHQLCNETEFNHMLSSSYAGETGESQQVAAGLEDHPDLLSLADQIPETEDLMDQEDDAPIVRLINALLSEAIRVGASDIHIEAFEKKLSVRLRVDGQLREIVQPRRELAPLLVSRIKVMAKLDIAEKRIPQDGRISLRLAGREVDVRVSTLPSSHGERVVMRLLDKQAGRLNMTHLGLMKPDYERLTQLVHRPHGIILVTGPTGSGKTTTLYAALSDLNDGSKNILTAEDPIEYQLEGIGQTQVNTKVDMTFARALKAMLRQDPDVVMVGEIRDLETAEIAVQASLTGHLVLSTLHTNTAIGAVTRLKDMGIEPFLLSSSLIGVIAQRLVRTLCSHCHTWREADDFEKDVFKPVSLESNLKLPVPNGCDFCSHTGFTGRTAIYEIVPIDEQMRRLIHGNAAEYELEEYARKDAGSIRDDGLRKVLAGKTTMEEVLRVTNEAAE